MAVRMMMFRVLLSCIFTGRYQCFGATVSTFTTEDGDSTFLSNFVNLPMNLHDVKIANIVKLATNGPLGLDPE
jgi:hypothetical protein